MIHSTQKRSKWNRVSRSNPCPICGRPDWCLTTGDSDAPDAAICARIESDKRVGVKGAGWLHKLRDDSEWRAPRVRSVYIRTEDEAIEQFDSLATELFHAIGTMRREYFAFELGVSADSLERLYVGWSSKYAAYSFPMIDSEGHVVGIRLRADSDGRKWSVRGGREGLFADGAALAHLACPYDKQLLICEGPTDTAAMLDLGFQTVGRPSCTGGLVALVELARIWGPEEVVIVADDDGPGHRGAWHLASKVVSYIPTVRVISPPDGIKDAREWKRQGATHADVMAAIEDAPALQIRCGVKAVSR